MSKSGGASCAFPILIKSFIPAAILLERGVLLRVGGAQPFG